MPITMDDGSATALLRLLTWLSPAFPVGAFAYSHGLERAIHDGLIHDRPTLTEWLEDLGRHGSAWNDAVLLAQSWHTAPGDSRGIADLAEAMAGSRERHMETMLQGGAFLAAAAAWPHPMLPEPDRDIPYPVAVGLAARAHGVPLELALTAYLHAFAANLVQAALRLVPLGQKDGVAVMAALERPLIAIAARATRSTLDDLGSSTLMSDITAMQHETQYSRVFRS
jgi:urease accessory protein